jgi:hypothetical protein
MDGVLLSEYKMNDDIHTFPAKARKRARKNNRAVAKKIGKTHAACQQRASCLRRHGVTLGNYSGRLGRASGTAHATGRASV